MKKMLVFPVRLIIVLVAFVFLASCGDKCDKETTYKSRLLDYYITLPNEWTAADGYKLDSISKAENDGFWCDLAFQKTEGFCSLAGLSIRVSTMELPRNFNEEVNNYFDYIRKKLGNSGHKVYDNVDIQPSKIMSIIDDDKELYINRISHFAYWFSRKSGVHVVSGNYNVSSGEYSSGGYTIVNKIHKIYRDGDKCVLLDIELSSDCNPQGFSDEIGYVLDTLSVMRR